jgi:outer membrane protein insertion porin family
LQEGGLSALIANADYFRRNLFGRCQTLTARVEISPSNLGNKPDIEIKMAYQDPWWGCTSCMQLPHSLKAPGDPTLEPMK